MKVNMKETITFFVIAIAIILFFNLPNYLAYVFTPNGVVFSGQAFAFDPWDINVYVSAINWAQKFGISFQNAYTTTPHTSFILYPLYTFAGILLPNINSMIIYNLLLIICGFVFLVTLYTSITILIPKRTAYWLLVLIVFAGGFEWVKFIILGTERSGYIPITFQNILERPHTMIAVSFYIISLTLFYKGVIQKRKKVIHLSALCTFGFAIFYPYYLVSYYSICFLFAFVFAINAGVNFSIKYIFRIVVISLPLGLLYSLYLISGNTFGDVYNPKGLSSPNFLNLLISLGITTPLIIYKAYKLKGEKFDTGIYFLLIWLVVSVSLAYIPVAFARYFLRDIFFPAVIISWIVLSEIFNKRYLINILKCIYVLLISSSTLYLIFLRIVNTTNLNISWFYLTANEYAAIEYLRENSQPGSGVMAEYPLSNHIPAHTYNRVYFGHFFQTPNSKEKITKQSYFYSGNMESETVAVLFNKEVISYVIFDKRNVIEHELLTEVYSNSEIVIKKFSHFSPYEPIKDKKL